MKKFLFALVGLTCFVGLYGKYIPFDVCDEPVFTPDSVSVRPLPVAIGKTLLVRIRGTADRVVTSGKFSYEISYRIHTVVATWYQTIYKDIEDLCHRAACPIQPGHIVLSYTKNLPPILAEGTYKIRIEAESNKGEKLMCIVVHLPFKQGSVAGGGASHHQT